ncbi:nuclear transport factor 2 family protein [Streptomyces sp. NPDC050704]|uniref:nuclear transport factor 2 family protein n=1 Tax=Streptomyces sp. NPDC050704 TaxID=3157219 RepID=UPI003448C89B
MLDGDREVGVGAYRAAVDTYVGSEYHRHSPRFPDGVAGVKAGAGAYFEQFPQLTIAPKRTIAEGDLVAVHSHYVEAPGERGRAVIDLPLVSARN